MSSGPVLIDYPAGPTAGAVLDFWQRPVCDLGLTGPDEGKGGHYLILGPHHDAAEHADSDRFVVRCGVSRLPLEIRWSLSGWKWLGPAQCFADTARHSAKREARVAGAVSPRVVEWWR